MLCGVLGEQLNGRGAPSQNQGDGNEAQTWFNVLFPMTHVESLSLAEEGGWEGRTSLTGAQR